MIETPIRRELDLLAQMLERHGATAMRCPLVAIRDVDDAAPVEAASGRATATRDPDEYTPGRLTEPEIAPTSRP